MKDWYLLKLKWLKNKNVYDKVIFLHVCQVRPHSISNGEL